MIPTTQLRILRTSLRAHPPLPSQRTLAITLSIARNRQTLPPCLLLLQPRHASSRAAAFSTSSLRRDAKAASAQPPPSPNEPELPPDLPDISHTHAAAANPPATTRPPPLDLPTRDPTKSAFAFYLATGKAYLKFYKTGLKHIYLNTRLVWSLDPPSSATQHPRFAVAAGALLAENNPANYRAAFLLRRRWAYDIRRLPPFALILLLCGEFTPFVVLAFPALVPYTCRIPRQIDARCRAAAARREESFKRLRKAMLKGVAPAVSGSGGVPQQQQEQQDQEQEQKTSSSRPEEDALLDLLEADKERPQHLLPRLTTAQLAVHIARAHSLISPLWDRLGTLGLPDTAVAFLAAHRAVTAHVHYLMMDDMLLRHHAIALPGLIGETVQERHLQEPKARMLVETVLTRDEVVLACQDRGLPLSSTPAEDAERLCQWFQYSNSSSTHSSHSVHRVVSQISFVLVLRLAYGHNADRILRRPNWGPAQSIESLLASIPIPGRQK